MKNEIKGAIIMLTKNNTENILDKEDFYSSLEQNLPAFFTRRESVKHLGGLFTAKSLSNIDSANNGAPKQLMGKKIVYEKYSFIQWLRNYFR